MTFKEARATARSLRGAGIGRFKEGGWFVDKSGRDKRDVFYVAKNGTLTPLTPAAEKFLGKKKKASDK